MMHSHQTAPTQFVEAGGIRFAYRRFGKTGVSAARLQPALHRHHGLLGPDGDGLARDRDVIHVQQRRRIQQFSA